MVADDPWLWTWEDLASQVCQSAQPFHPIGHQPLHDLDLQVLAQDFWMKRTTGREFMTNVDVEVLRTAFQINDVSKQSALLAIIASLRSRSHLYKQHAAIAGVQAMDLNNNSNSTPFESEPSSNETVLIDDNGRKRRKVSTFMTRPLPTEAGKERGRSIRPTGAQETAGNDWSHLLRWQQDGDDDYIVLDDEEEDIYDEDVVEVIEDEETDDVQTAQTGAGKIREEEVVNIINERINFFTTQWRPGKGWDQTKQPADPVRLWEEAEAAGHRQRLINQHKVNVDYYGQRLDRLGDEILKSSWNTVEEVRRVCGNLETTVDLLEEAEWLLGIYKLDPINENTDYETDAQGSIVGDDLVGLQHSRRIKIIALGSGSEASPSQQGDPDENLPNAEETKGRTPNRGGSTLGACIHTPESMAAVSVESDQSPGVVRHGRQPELASIHAVSQWDMNELVASRDRKRIIMKVVYEMNADNRELIRTRINSVRKRDLLKEIPVCVNMLWRKETKMQGVLQRDTYKIVIFTRLFLCWWLADNYFDNKEPTDWHLDELAGSLRAGCQDLEIFYDWVLYIFANTFREEALTMPCAPSQAEIIVISDDED